ncbi:MAG TPA: hypothetical protein VJ825_10780 [Gemmatimonadaceae bacterium]|nr:hypothetical protein [Gemmatimonadaceae bacterium]
MTAHERIRSTQRVLGAAAIGRALMWGIAIASGLVGLMSFARGALGSTGRLPATAVAVALAAGVVVAMAMLWRSRHFASLHRVALWIEEHVPTLHYSLVTALEHRDSPFVAGMESTIARHDISTTTSRAARRHLVPGIAALAIGLALLYVAQSGVAGRSGAIAGLGRLGGSTGIPAGSRLNDVRVSITPPAYAGGRTITLDDPATVSGLSGSAITVRGSGSPDGLTASQPAPIRIVRADGGWGFAFTMPTKPTAITLRDRSFERVIVLAPIADAPPKIALTSPRRDTTLRTPRLVVKLNANVSDDIGVSSGYFEYMITTGSGEIFKARTVNTPVVHFDGARSGILNATLDLASLKLGEGDVLSIRAVAQDGNTVSGPAVATSDTRTIRIARAGEYDSLAIEAAAPLPLDTSAVSQRMLIALTEQLVREQPKMSRDELVKRSTDIGNQEDGIRRRVQQILTEAEGAGEDVAEPKPGDAPATVEEMESPDVISGAKNPDLKAAYTALWQAVRSLKIAEPGPALPPMRVALAALDRARLANRLYLRGAPPKIVVNIERVRLTGKDKGSSSVRTPRSFADSARLDLTRRFYAMVDLLEKDPRRAVIELALLRVAALQTVPAFAGALGEVSDAIRTGRDATTPLLRARRALEPPPEVRPLGQWSRR